MSKAQERLAELTARWAQDEEAIVRDEQKEQQDEREWLALELASNISFGRFGDGSTWARWIDHRAGCRSNPVPCSDKPHPQSYGAHLPIRSVATPKADKRERAILARRPLVVRPCNIPDWRKSKLDKQEAPKIRARAEKRAAELSLSFSF